jgi:hypothetical protein
MNKLSDNKTITSSITSLTVAEQTHIKGGMAAMDEDKKKKITYRT